MSRQLRLLPGVLCCFIGLGVQPAFAGVHYNSKGLRDPFTDPSSLTPKKDPDQAQNILKSLKLQGILYSVGNPRAIVNGKIVAIGDQIAGPATVTAINKGSVELTANGKVFTLNETIRKTSNDTEKRPQIASVKKT